MFTPPPEQATQFGESVVVPTPQREEHAESEFTSISQRKPRLGKYRTLADQAASPESLHSLKVDCLETIRAQLFEQELSLAVQMDKLKTDLTKKADVGRGSTTSGRGSAVSGRASTRFN